VGWTHANSLEKFEWQRVPSSPHPKGRGERGEA
jgi:hypothetical protein